MKKILLVFCVPLLLGCYAAVTDETAINQKGDVFRGVALDNGEELERKYNDRYEGDVDSVLYRSRVRVGEVLRGDVTEGQILDVYTGETPGGSFSEHSPGKGKKQIFVLYLAEGRYMNASEYIGSEYEKNPKYRDLLRGEKVETGGWKRILYYSNYTAGFLLFMLVISGGVIWYVKRKK